MNVLNFLAAMRGEILANKARVTRDGKIVIIARQIDNVWEPTEAGTKMEEEYNIMMAKKEAAKPHVSAVVDKSPTKPRKTKV